uniref:GGDEF domain-containing protein n=1 Tax=Sulfurimonas sp. TaxID=2022749 RepID=UPI002612399D
CEHNSMEYLCIPFTISDEFSLVLTIHTSNTEQLATINAYNASIKNYLEAAKPVIESKMLLAKLRDNSLRDPMTNLYNRRFLEQFIDTLAGQIKREQESYSILMLDVDFFKMVNDTYGHDVGDKVIVAIGKVLQENVRESDLAIRYGGEEFLILLHNATEEGTLKIAKKVHSTFASIVFDAGNGETLQKTISIGISIFPKDANTIWKCIKLADTALYVAKTTGRNKIVRFDKKMAEKKELR